MKKALVIVAHPDDETIWCSGFILENQDYDWTIISLCRKSDLDREPRFRKACQILKAKSFISDLDDSEQGELKQISQQEIISRLTPFAGEYDLILTHGESGEYGHPRHIQVYNAVKHMIDKKIFSTTSCLSFSYHKNGKFCYIDKNADKFINLKSTLYLLKKDLIKNVYNFQRGSFENTCARKIEAFKKLK